MTQRAFSSEVKKRMQVKRRRRTPLQAGGACEAPPHENSTKHNGSIPKLNTYALYPSLLQAPGHVPAFFQSSEF